LIITEEKVEPLAKEPIFAEEVTHVKIDNDKDINKDSNKENNQESNKEINKDNNKEINKVNQLENSENVSGTQSEPNETTNRGSINSNGSNSKIINQKAINRANYYNPNNKNYYKNMQESLLNEKSPVIVNDPNESTPITKNTDKSFTKKDKNNNNSTNDNFNNNNNYYTNYNNINTYQNNSYPNNINSSNNKNTITNIINNNKQVNKTNNSFIINTNNKYQNKNNNQNNNQNNINNKNNPSYCNNKNYINFNNQSNQGNSNINIYNIETKQEFMEDKQVNNNEINSQVNNNEIKHIEGNENSGPTPSQQESNIDNKDKDSKTMLIKTTSVDELFQLDNIVNKDNLLNINTNTINTNTNNSNNSNDNSNVLITNNKDNSKDNSKANENFTKTIDNLNNQTNVTGKLEANILMNNMGLTLIPITNESDLNTNSNIKKEKKDRDKDRDGQDKDSVDSYDSKMGVSEDSNIDYKEGEDNDAEDEDDIDDNEESEEELEESDLDPESKLNKFITQDIEDQTSELAKHSSFKNNKVIFDDDFEPTEKLSKKDSNKINNKNEDREDNTNKDLRKKEGDNETEINSLLFKNDKTDVNGSTQKKPCDIIQLKDLSNIKEYIPSNKNYLAQNQNYAPVIFRGRDSTIHREYYTLKLMEKSHPKVILSNIENFEAKILMPLYQRTNIKINKKLTSYFKTFSKYKNIIYKTLNKFKVLKKIKPYGSYANNFLSEEADIDICIVPKCSIMEFSIYLEKVKDYIMSKNYAEFQLRHYNNRYLLLKIVDKESNNTVDITVHTMLPILNTKLIRSYSLYDQRFHILGLYLKHWTKINKIHGAADNYLSSYALLILLISFLQNVIEPRVLPNLQKVENKERNYVYSQGSTVLTTNIYFEEDINKINNYMDVENKGIKNTESAAALLVKFFEYYSYYYNYSIMKISISKNSNEFVKSDSDHESIAFSIDDPFDHTHDPGKSMIIDSMQFNKFVTSMKKEINLILNGEYLKKIDMLTSSNK